jgi:hypothetical protein
MCVKNTGEDPLVPDVLDKRYQGPLERAVVVTLSGTSVEEIDPVTNTSTFCILF